MAIRKPAVSTLLKQAQATIVELEKKLKEKETNLGYARDGQTAAEEELHQIHAFFDAMLGSIPKQDKETYKNNSAMTRLAAWLASTRN